MQATPLKPLGKFTEARMERGGSGIPAKTPLFVARIQTVQEWEPHLWDCRNLCAPSLAALRAVGACQQQSLLGVNQPYLRALRWGTDSSGSSAEFCRLSLLPKCLVFVGGTLVLLDWEGWLARARGKEGGGRQSEAHLLSCDLWLLLPGRSVFGRLSWALPSARVRGTQQAHHAPALQLLALSARQRSLQERVIPSAPWYSFRSYSWFLLRGVV